MREKWKKEKWKVWDGWGWSNNVYVGYALRQDPPMVAWVSLHTIFWMAAERLH